MEKRRTVPVKLDVDGADAAVLRDTGDEFPWVGTHVTARAFECDQVTTSRPKLHGETYGDGGENTSLHDNHVRAACNRAADACESVVENWKWKWKPKWKWTQAKKAPKPRFTGPHVVYDHRGATFHDDHARLVITDGRPNGDHVLPDEQRDPPHADVEREGRA